jgi:hypothetical protein
MFWNKIITKKNLLSYAYIMNLDSFIHIYFPVMIILNSFIPDSFGYFNIIFYLICIACIYFHPIITFNFVLISQIGSSLIISNMLFIGIYTLFGLSVHSVGEILFYLFVTLGIGITGHQFINNRLKNKLFTQNKF